LFVYFLSKLILLSKFKILKKRILEKLLFHKEKQNKMENKKYALYEKLLKYYFSTVFK